MKENWRTWENEKSYGDIFYKRAVGILPEMESSKSLARKIKPLVGDNNNILDVGCGSGHYLRTLDRELEVSFRYTGIDSTAYYIEKAKEAFLNGKPFINPRRRSTDFMIGDIFNLPVKDNFADLVICANVLLHLPSVLIPLKELIRVAFRYVIIRTLIGNSGFRIKHVKEPEAYDRDGEPVNYYYYNIYSEKYIEKLIMEIPGVKSVLFEYDTDFNPRKIGPKEYSDAGVEIPFNVTRIVNGMQVNHYVLQPWQFVVISKS